MATTLYTLEPDSANLTWINDAGSKEFNGRQITLSIPLYSQSTSQSDINGGYYDNLYSWSLYYNIVIKDIINGIINGIINIDTDNK